MVLIALLTDIHANREAYEACLAAAREAEAERLVILGDIVGYGADPQWCLDRTRQLMAEGAVVIRGNHDQAASEDTQSMNDNARRAIEWTRRQLDGEARVFLGSLPLTVSEEDRLYVHADASAPASWRYVLDEHGAERHLGATKARLSFSGHTHRPALYSLAPTGRVTTFTPNSSQPIGLASQRRWLATIGSVGQPRDGNPAAAFGLLDTTKTELSYRRVAYDIDKAADKIRAAGLPEALAARLYEGR